VRFPLGSPLPSEFSTDHEITQRERALVTRAPPHSPRPCGSPVRHRQSADGPAHRARERTRGSLRHAIPTLIPMLREWYRVSRSRWPQRGFPCAPLVRPHQPTTERASLHSVQPMHISNAYNLLRLPLTSVLGLILLSPSHESYIALLQISPIPPSRHRTQEELWSNSWTDPPRDFFAKTSG